MRDIARGGRVDHALLGYHFHGKQQIVAVLDEPNTQLLDRQAHMYRGTTRVSRQWPQACDLHEDESGQSFYTDPDPECASKGFPLGTRDQHASVAS